ncbi:hypothetical protein ACH5RR_000015 [Cinchona calisaya]|uniref:Uncharacterized protein n=1 Tax=Cinchona calisaya TaxID=153742 RepID=A0ABD3AZK4_9GENT
MGNCVFKLGFGEVEEMVKVVTSNGGIMELYAPITAECITNEFPGHRIFRSQDFLSAPLLHKEELHAGELYYLLPLVNKTSSSCTTDDTVKQQEAEEDTNTRSRRMRFNNNMSSQLSTATAAGATPYRMSFHHAKRSAADPEVFPRYNSTGVWKVRLVINPEQLSEILSQEARTEALIESVRTVAKCCAASSSTTTTSRVSSLAANSDQWSDSS